MKRLLIIFIKSYQFFISPWLGKNCRYYPSCSIYAQEAITFHGSLKGSGLAILRLLKCQPFSCGGYDPVPLPKKRNNRN